MIDHIRADRKIASDKHKYLIALYKNLDKLSSMPEFIAKEHYDSVRQCMKTGNGAYPDWYVGAVGFLASYNSRFFEGYSGIVHTKDGVVRNYYREAIRNLQAQVPALKYDLSGMEDHEKGALLEQLPAGATLFFRGHEMMYLGTEGGKVYVVSSASSLLNPFAPGRFRLRSVAINTMDLKRANGTTWLSNLYEALVPWSPQR